jgi:signal transduction histidine kinase
LAAAVIAAVALGGTLASQRHQHGARGLDVLGVTLLAAICAAMVLRRRHPGATLVIVTVGVAAYFSLGYALGPIFLPMVIAIVGAVLAGHRLLAWCTCTVMYACIVWGGYYLGGHGQRPGLATAVTTAAWPLLVLIGAEVLRSGRERAVSAARGRAELSRRRASEERLRIAQELHDVLAHNISLISVQAGVALHLMDERPERAAEQARTALTAIRHASKEALGELRSVLGMLRSDAGEHAPLSPVPGMAQLGDLTSRATAAGLTVRTDVTGQRRPLPAGVDLAAYRIVQEALTNVIRHAGARNVTVRVSYGHSSLGIEIEDDGGANRGGANSIDGGRDAAGGDHVGHGDGVNDSAEGAGNGIAGMRERARLLGGELVAGPLRGRGFGVRARLPLANPRTGGPAGERTAGTGGSAGADRTAGAGPAAATSSAVITAPSSSSSDQTDADPDAARTADQADAGTAGGIS